MSSSFSRTVVQIQNFVFKIGYRSYFLTDLNVSLTEILGNSKEN